MVVCRDSEHTGDAAEGNLLRDLFEGTTVMSALDHAKIEGANEPTARAVEAEAARVARRAAEALRRSRLAVQVESLHQSSGHRDPAPIALLSMLHSSRCNNAVTLITSVVKALMARLHQVMDVLGADLPVCHFPGMLRMFPACSGLPRPMANHHPMPTVYGQMRSFKNVLWLPLQPGFPSGSAIVDTLQRALLPASEVGDQRADVDGPLRRGGGAGARAAAALRQHRQPGAAGRAAGAAGAKEPR